MLFGISEYYNSDIMNIQNLRYFAIVAKLENVSRAAELMHTSQSSISKNIFTLEEELGTKLFDRHGKKLVLNFNNYAIKVKIDGAYYTVDAYGYIIIA